MTTRIQKWRHEYQAGRCADGNCSEADEWLDVVAMNDIMQAAGSWQLARWEAARLRGCLPGIVDPAQVSGWIGVDSQWPQWQWMPCRPEGPRCRCRRWLGTATPNGMRCVPLLPAQVRQQAELQDGSSEPTIARHPSVRRNDLGVLLDGRGKNARGLGVRSKLTVLAKAWQRSGSKERLERPGSKEPIQPIPTIPEEGKSGRSSGALWDSLGESTSRSQDTGQRHRCKLGYSRVGNWRNLTCRPCHSIPTMPD